MKNLILIFILFLGQKASFANGVSKIENAINNATLMEDYSSSVEFKTSDNVFIADWHKWLKRNNNGIYDPINSIAIKKIDVWKYGAEHTYITKIAFIKEENLKYYVAYYEKRREEATQRDNVAGILAIGSTLFVGSKIFNAMKENLKNADFSNSNNSPSTSRINQESKECDASDVPLFEEKYDGEKDNWIDKYNQYTIRFNDNKKGKIVFWISKGYWSIDAPCDFCTRNQYQDYKSKEDAINALYQWEKCATISNIGKR